MRYTTLDNTKKIVKNNYYNSEELTCPFCDFENLNQKILKKHENLQMLWCENKYPTLTEFEQTLILETDKCNYTLHQYEVDYIYELYKFIFDCANELHEKWNDVIILKNKGLKSGGTVPHDHTQIIGVPFESIPPNKEVFEGLSLLESDSCSINVSDKPLSEILEFNISFHEWNKDVAKEMKIFFEFLNKEEITSYNIIYFDTPIFKGFKVFSRMKLSFLFKSTHQIQIGLKDIELYKRNYESIVKDTYIQS